MSEAKNKNMLKRVLMTFFGVLFLGTAVGFMNYSSFGMDPFQVFAHGLGLHMPFSYGTSYVIISAIELVAIFIADKTKIGIGTFINLFLIGYVVDYSSMGITYVFDKLGGGLIIKIVSLIIGTVLLCFCAAIYFTADLGVSTHDAVSLIISEKQNKISFAALRVINDVFCIVVGFLLGQAFGVGTIVSAFFTGPLVAFFRRTVAEPMLYGKKKD